MNCTTNIFNGETLNVFNSRLITIEISSLSIPIKINSEHFKWKKKGIQTAKEERNSS
jgi:hypothetical protein